MAHRFIDRVRHTLAVPFVYRSFSRLIGSARGRDLFAREHIRAAEGQRVLDIGCGPADVLAHLPPLDYVGFDANAAYIETASKNYGDRGTFYCQRVSEESLEAHAGFDIVLAIAVLHHLDDDEGEHLFRLAHKALVPGGRLVTCDNVYIDGQSRVARFLISQDRGEHVRNEHEYVALALRVFSKVTPVVRSDLLRVPYTHLMLECVK